MFTNTQKRFFAPDEKDMKGGTGTIPAPKGLQTGQGPQASTVELTAEEKPKSETIEATINDISNTITRNPGTENERSFRMITFTTADGKIQPARPVSEGFFLSNAHVLKQGAKVSMTWDENIKDVTAYIDRETNTKRFHTTTGSALRNVTTLSEDQAALLTAHTEMELADIYGQKLTKYAEQPNVIKGITTLLSRRMKAPVQED